MVAYFQQGHKEFQNAATDDFIPHFSVTDELPFAIHKLGNVELGQVVDIQYKVGPPAICVMKLQLANHDPMVEISIQFCDLGLNNRAVLFFWIVVNCIFRWCARICDFAVGL
jgi:hypothetical protein